MITKLTSSKNYDLSFKEKIKNLENLKLKVNQLKRMIDDRDEDEEKSIIKYSHTKFIDNIIIKLEKSYKEQYIDHSRKRIERKNLKD